MKQALLPRINFKKSKRIFVLLVIRTRRQVRTVQLKFRCTMKLNRIRKKHFIFQEDISQGHPTSIFRKYLFGRWFEIYNFWNIYHCKISCLPASSRIFEHLNNGKIAHFKWIFTLKRWPRVFGSLFSGWNFRKDDIWSL